MKTKKQESKKDIELNLLYDLISKKDAEIQRLKHEILELKNEWQTEVSTMARAGLEQVRLIEEFKDQNAELQKENEMRKEYYELARGVNREVVNLINWLYENHKSVWLEFTDPLNKPKYDKMLSMVKTNQELQSRLDKLEKVIKEVNKLMTYNSLSFGNIDKIRELLNEVGK